MGAGGARVCLAIRHVCPRSDPLPASVHCMRDWCTAGYQCIAWYAIAVSSCQDRDLSNSPRATFTAGPATTACTATSCASRNMTNIETRGNVSRERTVTCCAPQQLCAQACRGGEMRRCKTRLAWPPAAGSRPGWPLPQSPAAHNLRVGGQIQESDGQHIAPMKSTRQALQLLLVVSPAARGCPEDWACTPVCQGVFASTAVKPSKGHHKLQTG